MVRIAAIGLGLAFGGEVLISQFVSVLLRTRIEASDATSVLAVVIYATMMAVGRFGNGPLMNRFDPITLLYGQGAVMAIGGAVIATSTTVPMTLIGSFIGGLGVAGVVPTILSYAATHARATPARRPARRCSAVISAASSCPSRRRSDLGPVDPGRYRLGRCRRPADDLVRSTAQAGRARVKSHRPPSCWLGRRRGHFPQGNAGQHDHAPDGRQQIPGRADREGKAEPTRRQIL